MVLLRAISVVMIRMNLLYLTVQEFKSLLVPLIWLLLPDSWNAWMLKIRWWPRSTRLQRSTQGLTLTPRPLIRLAFQLQSLLRPRRCLTHPSTHLATMPNQQLLTPPPRHAPGGGRAAGRGPGGGRGGGRGAAAPGSGGPGARQ